MSVIYDDNDLPTSNDAMHTYPKGPDARMHRSMSRPLINT